MSAYKIYKGVTARFTMVLLLVMLAISICYVRVQAHLPVENREFIQDTYSCVYEQDICGGWLLAAHGYTHTARWVCTYRLISPPRYGADGPPDSYSCVVWKNGCCTMPVQNQCTPLPGDCPPEWIHY